MSELLKMIHSMKKLYDHQCLNVMQKYQITRSELDILLFLYNNPEYDSAKDIVKKRGLTKSHASMGIEKLIQKHYIQAVQDNHDKRQYHLHLLEQSHSIIQDGLKVQKQFSDILFQGFSDKEKEIYQQMIERIHDNIKKEEKA